MTAPATTTTNGRPPFAEYVKAGLSAFPVRADGSKAPAVAWSAYQERRPTPEEAESWAGRFHGVAIAGGAVSGGLEVIDVDEPDLVRPFLSLVKDEAPDLYARLCLIRTPRRNDAGQGGCHIVYRVDGAVPGNTKLAMDGGQKPKTLIETRGEHGYIVTVGSAPKCHASGRVYEHVGGPPLTALSTITAGERDLLHRIARTCDRTPASAHRDNGHERGENRSPGDDYAGQVSWEDILTPHGWRPVRTVGDTTQWRRPGKETGISATTGLKSGSGNELLVVFSTNAAPFEGVNQAGRPGATYTKFAAYALLNHGGDYREAARALARLGYGDKRDGHAEYEREMGDQGSEPSDTGETAAPEDKPQATITYRSLTCAELVATKFETAWLVDYLIIDAQPLIVAGAKKTLKTSLLIDLALSLVWPAKFLGHFWVPEARQVGLMTGESGMETISETIIRVAESKGIDAAGITGLVITEDLPVFGHLGHVDAMRRWITDHELAAVVIDPAYMCLGEADANSAGNLFIVGQRLRSIATVCRECGVTLVVAHHTKRGGVDPHQPAELEDIAWAGFQEFARQWLLLARREKYEPGTGSHRLWLSAGGSAGHGGQWGLDIEEGIRSRESVRHWDVAVRDVDEIRETTQADREAAREEKAQKRAEAKIEDHKRRIVDAMMAFPQGESKSEIRTAAGLNTVQFGPAFADLIRSKDVVTCDVRKSNWKSPITGYKLADG